MSRLAAALRRVSPRSMAGQLTILLLAALVLSQAVTTLLLVSERREALATAAREEVMRDAVALARLIEGTPDDAHADLLIAAGTDQTIFSISQRNELTEPQMAPIAGGPQGGQGGGGRGVLDLLGGARVRAVREAVADRLNGGTLGDVQIFEALRPGGARPPPPPADGSPFATELAAAAAALPLPVSLAASVELTDGRWLNVASSVAATMPPMWPTYLSSGILALAMIGIVVFSVRRITRPLRALAAASDRLGHGETLPPLALSGPREVRLATGAFNAMQERLTRFVRDRTAMLAAISHDLRTPITSLRLRAEFVDDPEMRERLIGTLDEMQQMTEATLVFAREDQTREATRVVDLAALAESVALDLADLGKPALFAGGERLPYPCRPTSLKRAVRNLAENAIRYGGGARVLVRSGPDGPEIVIEDDGPGIPPDRVEAMFEPFVRLDASRNEDTGGVGLGLSIARSVARAQGGEVELRNRAEGGLTAVIRLPRRQPVLAP